MNLMLLGVAIVSLVIDRVPTAILVACLVALNLVLGFARSCRRRPGWMRFRRCRFRSPGSAGDLRPYSRLSDYSRAARAMIASTDTSAGPLCGPHRRQEAGEARHDQTDAGRRPQRADRLASRGGARTTFTSG